MRKVELDFVDDKVQAEFHNPAKKVLPLPFSNFYLNSYQIMKIIDF